MADSADVDEGGAIGGAAAEVADGAEGRGAGSGDNNVTKKSSWRIGAGLGGASRSLAARHNRLAANT
ncbi:hypothetical protein I6I07_16780 [Achromobacter deleyi]|uniref:Uncharacterized protein n=1 Tax=Achromobacter deleyi TaxID=1353891 RepID=A0A7T4E0N4_9BURK|nr:hypothetical protein [Achromobacter deleyi]QQB32347.1 hypothetical protein I6I07_16780 [Achromobacter deleyi]